MTLAADIADGILAWCGVDSPTPADASVAQMCADAAIAAIREYRRLDHANTWLADHDYVVGDTVVPTHPNGHVYQCTTAGTSYTTEPTWTDGAGDEVEDYTVVWTEYVRSFETRFTPLAIEMGVYLWQKRGVDGVVAFGENGVQQSYEAGSFPKSMLSRIPLPAKTG